MNLRDLHEQRGRAVAAMRALTAGPKGADGDLDQDQAQQFDRMKGELEALDRRIGRQVYVDDLDHRAPGTTIAGTGDGKLDSELRNFSLVRAIVAQVPDLHIDAGREREISSELQRRSGRPHQGLTVPLAALETRTQQANVGTAGGFLSSEVHRGDLFVDSLRARLITGRLGATVLNDLAGGGVTIPQRTASATAYWVSEDTAITTSDAAFGQLRLTPRTVGARSEMTRDLLMQSSPSIEQLVRSDFSTVIAQAIDTAAINGSGVGAEPTGLLQQSIGSFSLSTVNYVNVLDAIEDIETANATATGWATNPHVTGVLMSTLKTTADTASNMIMTEPGTLAGYPLVSSTLVPATINTNKSALIFGNWADLVIGYWGSFDLLVNPYESTAYSRGNVQVRAMLTCDVAVRHLEFFTAAQDIT